MIRPSSTARARTPGRSTARPSTSPIRSRQKAAEAYIDQLDAAGAYPSPIVTEVKPLDVFYPAEDYHQDYAFLHPDQPYISWNDLPKVTNLHELFPDVWRDEPKLVFAENAM